MTRRTTFLLAAMALTCVGCDEVKGSGQVTTERRQVGSFSAVEAEGAVELEVTQGTPARLDLECDANLLPLVKTEVRRDTLHIGSQERLRPSKRLLVRVTTPTLKAIDCSGAAELTVTGVANDALRVGLSGAGSAKLTGRTGRLELTISGAGDVQATDLAAQHVVVAGTGATDAAVHATESLEVNLVGAGTVRYRGKPKTVKQSITGAGELVAE